MLIVLDFCPEFSLMVQKMCMFTKDYNTVFLLSCDSNVLRTLKVSFSLYIYGLAKSSSDSTLIAKAKERLLKLTLRREALFD